MIRQTTIRVTQVEPEGLHSALSNSVTFACTIDYDPQQCLTGATTLAKVLAAYPTALLGEWRFVLAGSQHWKQTIKALGGDTESPAFTDLDARATVLEDTLFENASTRKINLSQRFQQSAGSMLDFAVAHEMGHAICHVHNEKQADEYGLDLRKGITPPCAIGR
jgi:hypothetical protein